MPQFLKSHPFAVEAFFDSSLVVTYAIDAKRLDPYVPNCLSLDELRGSAFLAVAIVQTRELRPAGWPKFLGQDFFLIGYRLFVRFESETGRSLRGLYILRSETNKRRMQFSGNLFTHYAYRTVDVQRASHDDETTIRSHKSGLAVTYRSGTQTDVELPSTSPFANWQEARKFAGPLPYTFTIEESKDRVLIIEGVRENW
ncbi:MAG TPA: DUF2071 domain-containing protein, partial [Pyrinomonadaceae bacterium]